MKKNIIFIALSLMSLNAFAGDIAFTNAHFRIVKVQPFCEGRPNGPYCEALGGKVTVETTIGCLDKLIFSHFELANNTEVQTLRAISVVRADSDSARVRCMVKPLRQTVTITDLSGSQLEILNEEIH